MQYDKIKEISEKVISEIENNPELKEMNDMIKSDFLYLTTERDYLSIDVNNYDFRDNNYGNGSILTFEDDDSGQSFKTMLWSNNEGFPFGEDIKKGLIKAQSKAVNLAEEYEVSYSSENKHKKQISI